MAGERGTELRQPLGRKLALAVAQLERCLLVRVLEERGEGAHAVEGVQLLVPQLEHAVLVDDLVRARVRVS